VRQGRSFIGTKLEFDPLHFANHSQMTVGHPVGVGDAVIVQSLPEILGLANIKNVVGGVLHQVNAGPPRGFAEKPPAQPLFERSRIRDKEQLRHAADRV
jgi:hypothetical protein